MATRKSLCPECSTHTISFRPKAMGIVWDEQTKMKKAKEPIHKRTVEAVVNRMIEQCGGLR